MFRAHVLIIKKSKLHYTASGVVTPIGCRLVHRLREDVKKMYSLLQTEHSYENEYQNIRSGIQTGSMEASKKGSQT